MTKIVNIGMTNFVQEQLGYTFAGQNFGQDDERAATVTGYLSFDFIAVAFGQRQ